MRWKRILAVVDQTFYLMFDICWNSRPISWWLFIIELKNTWWNLELKIPSSKYKLRVYLFCTNVTYFSNAIFSFASERGISVSFHYVLAMFRIGGKESRHKENTPSMYLRKPEKLLATLSPEQQRELHRGPPLRIDGTWKTQMGSESPGPKGRGTAAKVTPV